MIIAVQNGLFDFKKDGNGAGEAVATDASIIERIVKGDSTPNR
jgi:hypothetical protein